MDFDEECAHAQSIENAIDQAMKVAVFYVGSELSIDPPTSYVTFEGGRWVGNLTVEIGDIPCQDAETALSSLAVAFREIAASLESQTQ